jgi:RNase P subunit RPR2
MTEAYCVKCKAKREMKDAEEVTMKNGKPAVKGKCHECGTGMYRIGAKK